jgi:hypothetical protein
MLKNPLPNYEKGESSILDTKGKNVNHVHDTLILHLSTMGIKTMMLKMMIGET